jgi:hypothetical protein
MAQRMTYSVTGVPSSNLHNVWTDAWHYLNLAVERFPNVPQKYTEGEILRALFAREMQLWIGWDYERDETCGALLTEIIRDENHPDKVFLSIPLVGADNWNAWGDGLWTMLKAWGVENGCTHALGYGRRGWMRLYGFVNCGTTDGGLPMFVRTLKR